ncbi:hypothetical protein [Enterococcus timonensis]|uniref:hypothetical protein n=1 Tax=Enterococcus timonensis TaxID=1852364 RepID=UPI0008DABEE5|nr:hypothetical protein [Enterococcus timonensis]
MRFYDDLQELIVELIADIADIGNENIWAFYEEKDGKKLYTDYRFKNDPAEKQPAGFGVEKSEEIKASQLLPLLKEQKQNHPNF